MENLGRGGYNLRGGWFDVNYRKTIRSNLYYLFNKRLINYEVSIFNMYSKFETQFVPTDVPNFVKVGLNYRGFYILNGCGFYTQV